MGLTRQSDSDTIYLQVKDYSIWRELKRQEDGCDVITVENPRTKEILTKYGYKYKSIEGLAVSLAPYSNEHAGVKYAGFKLVLEDADDRYSLDMSHNGQLLRRFLRCAPNFNWSHPLKISAFKSKKENPGDPDSTGIWFQQGAETVPPFYTRTDPHGMPEAIKDELSGEWDFKTQNRWLVNKLTTETIPAIEASRSHAPVTRHEDEQGAPPPNDFDGDGDI